MKKILLLLPLALAAAFLQTGCVVGRRTVSLPINEVAAPASPKGDFRVETVSDNRIFENKPAQPSIPSIDGDVNKMSAAQKGGMIGRQRNTYGKAMGDIALPAGDSVNQRVKLLVEQGLKQRGYRVTDDPAAPNATSVSIDEFWAWFSPGMWSVGFDARVSCTLTLRNGDRSTTIVVKGVGENRGQVASDANWQLAYDRAFTDFLEKLGSELARNGF
jgi:hypothetical protein